MLLPRRLLPRRALLAAPLLLAAGKPPLAAVPIARTDLAWWRDRHAAKLAALKRGPVDLIFLGDSITQDLERSGPPAWADIHPVWQRFYADRRAINLGFSGDATSHLLWRIMNGEIANIAPKAAIILIGANNLGRLQWPAADTVIGIDTIIAETRRRLPRTKILLRGILPSERSAWATETTRSINAALAAKYGPGTSPNVMFHDHTPLFHRNGTLDRTLFYDPLMTPPEAPLHPTAAAHERMALALEPLLAPMLGDRPRVAG